MRKLAACLVALAACHGSEGAPGAPADAGHEMDATREPGDDGSSPERARDAESEQDAADERDAQAGGDAGPLSDEELSARVERLSWTNADWIADACPMQVARDVSSLPRLSWTRVSDDPVTCEVLRGADPATSGGFRTWHPFADDQAGTVFYDADGAPKLAFRGPRLCGVAAIKAGSEVCYGLGPKVGGDFDTRIKCGDPLAESPVYKTTEGIYFSVGTPETLVISEYPAQTTASFRRADEPATAISLALGGDIWGLAAQGRMAVSWVFKIENNQFAGKLLRSDDGGPWSMLRDPGAPKHVASLHSTETQLAWLETEEQSFTQYQDAQLYVAPWPAPGAALSPRKVGTVDNYISDEWLAVSDSYFAHSAGSELHLFRLSDGARWVVPSPAGYRKYFGDDSRVYLDDAYVAYGGYNMADSTPALIRCKLAEVTK